MVANPGEGFPREVHLVRLNDKKLWRVGQHFECVLRDGSRIGVPADFVTDLASVPRLPLTYLFLAGRAVVAGVVHDLLYYGGEVNRARADDVFYELLRAEGLGRVSSWSMWVGVRVGGWLPWGRHRRRTKVLAITFLIFTSLVSTGCGALPEDWSVSAEGYASCPWTGEVGGRIECRIGRQSE